MSDARADRLTALLAERELDALLVTNLTSVRYLTGFTGTNGVCVVSEQQRIFLTDFRYIERADAEVSGFDRLKGERDLLGDAAERLSGRVGFEDQHLSVRAHRRLGDLVPGGVELLPAGGLIESLRAVKDPAELSAMRAAAALADDIYGYLADRAVVGRTEREIAVDLEREMRERGADEPAFETIVASGPHGALPHAVPRREPVAADTLVVVDLGCLVDGYCSDCTRTFATGTLSDEAAQTYALVLDAQARGRAAVSEGAGCREVDAVARQVIAAAGYGERFGHGLGHGVGLEVHEEPRLSPSADGDLSAGNTVTVEPGVYLPGRFGVRIEDLVAVNEDGCEVLSGFTKELVTLDG